MDNMNKLMYLVVNAFHIYTYFYFFSIFFNRKSVNKLLEAACYAAFFFINSLSFLLINNPYINLLSSIVPLMAISFLYPGLIRNKILIGALNYVVSMLLDSICFNIILESELSWRFSASLLTNAISSLAFFLVSLVIGKVRSFKLQPKIDLAQLTAIIFIPLGNMIIVMLAFYTGFEFWANIVLVAILLAITTVIFRLFDISTKYYQTLYEKQLLNRQNEAQMNQLQLIQEANRATSAFRHDTVNHIEALRAFLQHGETEKALIYLDRFAEKLKPASLYVNSGNLVIDSLLNFKLEQMKDWNVHQEITVCVPVNLNISDYHLCIILGNLLDNAVEALRRAEEKILHVSLRFEKNALYMKVENTYTGIVKKVLRHGKFVYMTTKENPAGHGIGLSNIERVVSECGGEVEIHTDNQLFRVEIILPAA